MDLMTIILCYIYFALWTKNNNTFIDKCTRNLSWPLIQFK